jgi:RNA polymerase sigma factor (sigma-70 family)
MKTVIRHLRRVALLYAAEGLTDSQLLEAFLSRREEAAFEVLLRRYGPMVMGVCRRVLRNAHDAEDAFQATFMVLARKAGSLRSRELLANWLYGVAYRTAMKARAMNTKRRAKERHACAIPHSDAASSADEALLERLDHELSRLPDKYRVPVVLCELEGRSRREVARMLTIPEGTLSSRLAKAKKLLARKLSRYGTLVLAALSSESAASACVTPALRASTAKAVLSAGSVPAKVLALTEGVMKAMLLSKLKITACAAALMLLAGVGATGLTYRATAQQPGQANRLQADELDALRLEIEALRKSLQATRERVKTLEGEVTALKGQSGRPPRGRAGAPGAVPGVGAGAPGTPSIGAQPPAQGAAADLPGGDIPGTHPSGSPAGGAGGLKASKMQGGMGMHPPGMMGGPGGGMMPMGPGHGMGIGIGGHSGQGKGGARASNKRPDGGEEGVTTGSNPFGQSRAGKRGSKLPDTTTDPLSDAASALDKLRANPDDKEAVEALELALKKLKEQKKPHVSGPGPRS